MVTKECSQVRTALKQRISDIPPILVKNVKGFVENAYSFIAENEHSSTHNPHSMHFSASMTAMSSTVIAPSGQTSSHAPQAVHSESIMDTI